MNPSLLQRLRRLEPQLVESLLAERNPSGHWDGELSSSALSTATATIALSALDRHGNQTWIRQGLDWLAKNANSDGGWGDTTRSRSNLSTTSLAWAAFSAAQADQSHADTVARARDYIQQRSGSLDQLVPTIEGLYGSDRTFSVPITMTLALSGRLGPEGWKRVRPLPYELAALPRSLFGMLRLPVVSYALPALIAIGQVIQHHAPRPNPLRHWTKARTLDILGQLQPPNGGFLEATPLTSFVTMSLAGMGLGHHAVARRGEAFLKASIRPDGSWPIDTNLATWVTTLSIKALRHYPSALDPASRSHTLNWLLDQQYQVIHPYTGAAPGGWAWTDLPGGVPDADDTAGALLALKALNGSNPACLSAVGKGVTWLLDLQNADGGIPTFCRGWGALPFDRSTPELTAHALRAIEAWKHALPTAVSRRLPGATRRAWNYLAKSQGTQGEWIPLWFGNEHAPGQNNPVYGTAQVLIAMNEIPDAPVPDSQRKRAVNFLLNQRNASGLWGGDVSCPASIEESALVLEAIAGLPTAYKGLAQAELDRSLEAFCDALEKGMPPVSTPIGLYFARLWYFERLYPLIFATSALGAISNQR